MQDAARRGMPRGAGRVSCSANSGSDHVCAAERSQGSEGPLRPLPAGRCQLIWRTLSKKLLISDEIVSTLCCISVAADRNVALVESAESMAC